MLENGRFTTCARHPSQNFVGFCSFCLHEKLTSINRLDIRSQKGSCGLLGEVADFSDSTFDLCRKPRKTLLSLFHLDDGDDKVDISRDEDVERDPTLMGQKDEDKVGLSENDCELEIRTFQCGDEPASAQTGMSFDRGSLETDIKGSSSCSTTIENLSIDTCVVKKHDSAEDVILKQKGSPFWLGSLSRKVLKWGSAGAFRESSLLERSLCCGYEEKRQMQTLCDWSLDDDSHKTTWDDPRHSWDGPVLSRSSSICSFSCLEGGDGNSRSRSETNCQIFSKPARRRRCHMNPKQSSVSTDHVHVSHRLSSKRWCKVWNWSVNTPFRDFSQRREPALKRSFSESCRECHQVKTVKAMESDSGLSSYGKVTSSSRADTYFGQRRNFGRGDTQSSRLDRQRSHGGYQFGHSRSVHYSSPGHAESGLLRLYLTPLRRSIRNSNRGRTRTSGSYVRGVFGL